ncbi:MAG: GerMN domain-containing protein [Candidatus Spechtbacterales bacterium]
MKQPTRTILTLLIVVALFAVLGFLGFQIAREGTQTANDQETPEDTDNGDEADVQTRSVLLFYYNQELDPEVTCSATAVTSVERSIPVTQTPIQDTIRLLLSGNLSSRERALGFTTEFPGEGLSLVGANLADDGTLTLEFSDPNGFTVGGSCRVGLLYAQVEKTALQFDEVTDVVIIPEELFQP